MDDPTSTELERRLSLIETPGSGEQPLAPLPWRDVVISVVALVAVSLLLLWWSL